MRHIDGVYTQRFNRTHGRDGALFRGRYKAIVIDADEYLSAVVRYIHLNAVEAGVVKRPEDYRWSTHRLYLQMRKGPAWLNTSEVLEQIGNRRAYQEFVLSGNEEEIERFYSSGRQSPVLGGEKFIEGVRGRLGKLGREHPRYERVRVEVGPQAVIRRVARFYKLSLDDISWGCRGKGNEARKVAMYLVKRCCDQTLLQTAKIFNVGSYGVVGWACHGIQARVEKEKNFRDEVNRIVETISQQKI